MAASIVGLICTQLGGMSALPYYLHQTQHKRSLFRAGITIGSLGIFGYMLPLNICHKLMPKTPLTKAQKESKKKAKPNPLRSILMLYVCLWLYKIIEMQFEPNYFSRCNIRKPWQSVLSAFVPGVFFFDPKTKKMPNFNWRPRAFWKLFEFVSYAMIMFCEITICRKYSIEKLKKIPQFLQFYMFYAFIASWIQIQNNLFALITTFVLRDRVFIRFPYKTAILSMGWREFWNRWSVSIGSALRYTIYYPLIKDKGYHPLVGVIAVFGFNAFMHHWFAMLIEDVPHFEGYCVGMTVCGLATFVEVYLKRMFKIAKTSKVFKGFFLFWHHFTLYQLAKVLIWKYRVIDVSMEDLKGENLK